VSISRNLQIALTSFSILLLAIALYFSINAIYGLFMCLWIANDLIRKETYLIGHIKKDDFPIMYWVVIACWSFFTVLYFIY